MPVIQCPVANCSYVTEDVDAVVAASLLNLHATDHATRATPSTATTPQVEKVKRPAIFPAGTSEDWSYFQSRWSEYKAATKLQGNDIVIQLLECCDEQLRKDQTRNAGGSLSGKPEATVMAAIKSLALDGGASSRSIAIDNRFCNRFINLGRPIFSLNHSGASAATVFTFPTTFGTADAPCDTRAERATQSAARVGSSLFDFLTVPSTHDVPKIVFTFSPICRACKNSIAIYLIIMRDLIFFLCIGPHQQSAIESSGWLW